MLNLLYLIFLISADTITTYRYLMVHTFYVQLFNDIYQVNIFWWVMQVAWNHQEWRWWKKAFLRNFKLMISTTILQFIHLLSQVNPFLVSDGWIIIYISCTILIAPTLKDRFYAIWIFSGTSCQPVNFFNWSQFFSQQHSR